MAFLRVVEFFQPLFEGRPGRPIDLGRGVDGFLAGVKRARGCFDVALVGDHKDPGLLKFSSVQSAALVEKELGVPAAPVIVARDSNRPQTLSAVVTAYGLGLRNIMLAWGDRYLPGRPKNVYDFTGLGALISEARGIATRAGITVRIFAPLDVESLKTGRGVAVARSRLKAGADLLLAQPPTTDAEAELSRHLGLLSQAGLGESVLLNAFPFKDEEDVLHCEGFFGWTLPPELHRRAAGGRAALDDCARDVVNALRKRGSAGVYVSTRGEPENARAILG